MEMMIFNKARSTFETFYNSPLKSLYTFCLDSAAEIHGMANVFCTKIKILSNWESEYISVGFNFIDKSRFPKYEDSDIEEVFDFKVTTKLRTLLDLMWDNYDEVVIYYIDELRGEYSAEEIISYFKGKNLEEFLFRFLDTLNYDIYTQECLFFK